MRGLVVAIGLAVATRASARRANESIVVASDDPAFRVALDDALAPAGLTVLPVDHEAAPSLADLTTASRALAERVHATATVWLIAAPPGATLVTYDRDVDRLLVRALDFAPPFDAARAAEAARMARTMLRALRVTPDSDLPPPHAVDAPATHASAPLRPVAPALFATSLGLGARLRAPAQDVALDVSAAIAWRPDTLGIALAGSFAPSAELATPAFSGTIRDDSLAVVARLPVRASQHARTGLVAMAGAALHLVALRGMVATGAASSSSLDPAARLGVIGVFALDPSVDVGLAVSADYLLERQKYEAGTEEILTLPRLSLSTTLILSLRIL